MLTAGTKLGPYEIVSSLGAGGMGEVEAYCGRERGKRSVADAGVRSRNPERSRVGGGVEGSLC